MPEAQQTPQVEVRLDPNARITSPRGRLTQAVVEQRIRTAFVNQRLPIERFRLYRARAALNRKGRHLEELLTLLHGRGAPNKVNFRDSRNLEKNALCFVTYYNFYVTLQMLLKGDIPLRLKQHSMKTVISFESFANKHDQTGLLVETAISLIIVCNFL